MRMINADAIEYKESKIDTVYRSTEDMSLWHEKSILEWVSKETIDKIPTIEAEPVRYGHWDIFHNDNIPFAFKCSECAQLTIVATKFCPSCGCKMDLKEVEEE